MKNLCLALGFIAVSGMAARAQIGNGGIPESMQQRNMQQYVPVSTPALPDWKAYQAREAADVNAGITKPLIVALLTASDIAFPASGVITTLEDGRRIWRSQVKIAGAPAVGFYYDRFQLPEGVKYFIANAGGSQILGSYTREHNAPGGLFATEAVQGDVVNLEMDIDAGVNLDDINFHINRSAVYFRSYEYLNQYADLHTLDASPIDTALDGSSSVCMINAICPLGVRYPTQRKATVQTLYILPGDMVSVCSATMINNTGNTGGTCKQYLLTASHCQGQNDTLSAAFNQVLVRFNFERALCTGGVVPEARTMAGVNFVARSNYNEAAGAGAIKGDFMLLELRQAIPEAWNVTLNGWSRDPDHALTVTAPKKFIGFHHPSGDVKKVSAGQAISSSSIGAANTHWRIEFDSGYVAQGSSGSGLFDGDGYLMGIASVAPLSNSGACALNGKGVAVDYSKSINYSKFSYVWDYTVDGNSPIRKLKPWLDPANTGATTLNPVKSNCAVIESSGTAVKDMDRELGGAISVYPNPSVNGKVTVQVNLAAAADLRVDIYDITGKKQQSIQLPKVKSGSINIDLSAYANGMYIMNFSNGSAVTAKKVMLAR